MKFKHVLKWIYNIIPFKYHLFVFVKLIGLHETDWFVKSNIWRYLKFQHRFKFTSDSKNIWINNTGGYLETDIFWNGLNKSDEGTALNIWNNLCKQANIIFDIGANSGIYSLVAKASNSSSEVIAFEPSLSTIKKLENNCIMNNFNVIIESLAISNTNDRVVFYDVYEDNQKSASLSPDKLKNFIYYKGEINEYFVETITLDNYIEEKNIPNIDLIKLDVELFEPEVLEGFGKYFLIYRPVILIEILAERIADRINGFLKNKDYQIFHIDNNAGLKKVDSVFVFHKNYNFLLCPAEKAAQYYLNSQ